MNDINMGNSSLHYQRMDSDDNVDYQYGDQGDMMTAEEGTGLLGGGDGHSIDDTISQDGDDDALSVASQESAEGLADRETRAVSWLRAAVLTVLGLATVCVSWTTYTRTRNAQHAQFHAAFGDAAAKLLESFAVQERWMDPLQALGVDLLSYARHAPDAAWPQVDLPDFAQHAEVVRNAASLLVLPLVAQSKDLADWETFSVQHQEWLQEGSATSLTTQVALEGESAVSATVRRLEATGIADHVFNFDGPVSGTGPFLPLWQTFPVTQNLTQWVNLDMQAVQRIQPALQQALDKQRAVVASVVNMAGNSDEAPAEPEALGALLDTILGAPTDYSTEPVSPLIYPLVDNDENDNRREVQGA